MSKKVLLEVFSPSEGGKIASLYHDPDQYGKFGDEEEVTEQEAIERGGRPCPSCYTEQ